MTVIGNDATVAFAGTSGNFELNVMVPVIARNVVSSLKLLTSASTALADRCLSGLVADVVAMRSVVDRAAMSVTALAPQLGYDIARSIVLDAEATHRRVSDVVAQRYPDLVGLLDPLRLADPTATSNTAPEHGS